MDRYTFSKSKTMPSQSQPKDSTHEFTVHKTYEKNNTTTDLTIQIAASSMGKPINLQVNVNHVQLNQALKIGQKSSNLLIKVSEEKDKSAGNDGQSEQVKISENNSRTPIKISSHQEYNQSKVNEQINQALFKTSISILKRQKDKGKKMSKIQKLKRTNFNFADHQKDEDHHENFDKDKYKEGGQMFLERNERPAVCQIPYPNQFKSKQIVHLEQSIKQNRRDDKIKLNSITYDIRPINLRRNKITISSLLYEEVDGNIFHQQPYSVNVQSLMITTFDFQNGVFLPILKKGLPIFIFNSQKPGEVRRKCFGFQNLTIISPPKINERYGVFNTKLWLVKFKTFLRVIVSTGNNNLTDWTVWQNAYWYHDFPLLLKKEISKQSKTEQIVQNQSGWGQIKDFDYQKDFLITLKRVITEMNPKDFDILKDMKLDLDKYQYTGIDVVLIPSFPGRFKGQERKLVGIGKVSMIMLQHKKRLTKAKMTCNSISLEDLDQNFIRQFYFAFNPWVDQLNIKHFQLVYPTESYIIKQTCMHAGAILLDKENYEKCLLKKDIFYKYEKSAQNGVTGGIPHFNTIIIQEIEGNEDKCIFYLGSHNLTRAAWGTFQKDETFYKNSELGLLFLGYNKVELKYWLPYKWPADKYNEEDTPFIRDSYSTFMINSPPRIWDSQQ